MIVFTEEVILNKGIWMYVTGGIHNKRYKGTSMGRKQYINR
jgi:hypothetical protein